MQRWDINVIRRVQSSGQEDSWTPAHRTTSSFLAPSGTLEGLTDLKRGLVLDIDPIVTVKTDGAPVSASWSWSPSRPPYGGNVRCGITPNLTVNGTLNPDFAQVEADAGQFAFDPRSALFLPGEAAVLSRRLRTVLGAEQLDLHAPCDVADCRDEADYRLQFQAGGSRTRTNGTTKSAPIWQAISNRDDHHVDYRRDVSRTNLPIVIRHRSTGIYTFALGSERNRIRVDALPFYQPRPGTVFFAVHGSSLIEPHVLLRSPVAHERRVLREAEVSVPHVGGRKPCGATAGAATARGDGGDWRIGTRITTAHLAVVRSFAE